MVNRSLADDHLRTQSTRRTLASNRANDLLALIVLVIALFAIGICGLLWGNWSRLALAPTATPTPTHSLPPTVTPDIAGTRAAQAVMTQIAMGQGLLTANPVTVEETPVATPGTPSSVVLLPVAPNSSSTPVAVSTVIIATPTPTTEKIMLPVVRVDLTSTPTEVPTETPTLPLPSDTPTDIATPEFTATPITTPTPELATATFEPTPTFTPPPTPTPTATTFTVGQLVGLVDPQGATMRVGPGSMYESIKELAAGVQVRLLARDNTGEWVYVCCQDDVSGWVRQFFVKPSDNTLPDGAPTGADPNNVRWLRVQPVPSGLALPPESPPIPANAYPLARYNNAGMAFVPVMPKLPLISSWSNVARALADFVSPAIVSDRSVIGYSADGHLYSFTRENGDQRWRNDNFGNRITKAPAVRDAWIYAVDDGGEVYGIEDLNSSGEVRWRRTVEVDSTRLVAATAINMLGDILLFGARNGDAYYLIGLNRSDGGNRFNPVAIPGTNMRYPAIGNQLVYAGNEFVQAIDASNGQIIWQNTAIRNIVAGPVYRSPGPVELAELYVVDGGNVLHVLDANIGDSAGATFGSGETVTGIAVNEGTIFLSGPNYVKAISRKDRNQLWRTGVSGEPLGGVIVSAETVLVVTSSGVLQMLNVADGVTVDTEVIGTNILAPAAVAGQYIVMPILGNTMRVYMGAP